MGTSDPSLPLFLAAAHTENPIASSRNAHGRNHQEVNEGTLSSRLMFPMEGSARLFVHAQIFFNLGDAAAQIV